MNSTERKILLEKRLSAQVELDALNADKESYYGDLWPLWNRKVASCQNRILWVNSILEEADRRNETPENHG